MLNLPFKFLIGDLTGEKWYGSDDDGKDRWEEISFLRKMISPGEILFECGAHHGCATILLSKWLNDDGLIVSFEPNLKNAQIMKKKYGNK